VSNRVTSAHPAHAPVPEELRAPVPEEFLGFWQRTLLEVAGAEREAGWQVFWLQTRRWHGDLRVPVQRPDFAGCRSLADCVPEQRRWLAAQKGFAGITEISAGPGPDDSTATFCQWNRVVDFQPARPTRDYGRIVFHPGGGALDEIGVDSNYRETWVRLPQSMGATAAWRKDGSDAGFGELLLVAGNCFFYLRDRAGAVPAGISLAEIANSPDATMCLDMELSAGRWEMTSQSGVVTHSTLPWCEGRSIGADDGWVPAT
jgi:hypothetical protein